MEEVFILKAVKEIRTELPRLGIKKVHFMLSEKLSPHGISIGRDRLYELAGEHGFLLRYRRRKPYTTDSNHPYYKYPNLIQNLLLTKPNQLWVSDITYISLMGKFAYLSIITDAYSHKIVGYWLHPSLHTEGVLKAFQMARNGAKVLQGLIHHSDRGTQYCCGDYVQMLQSYSIQISMTENGDPYENAIAERVNGILKTELGLGVSFKSYDEAKETVDTAIRKYNDIRPHYSCDLLTPTAAHLREGTLKKHWKKQTQQVSVPVNG